MSIGAGEVVRVQVGRVQRSRDEMGWVRWVGVQVRMGAGEDLRVQDRMGAGEKGCRCGGMQ